MRRLISIAVVACALCPAAFGAAATFQPALVVVPPGGLAEFEVYVEPDALTAFNAADVLIGWNELPDLFFEYSTEWQAMMDMSLTTPVFDSGPYTRDVFVGGLASASSNTAVHLGTLTADTSNLADGDYTISIDAAFDGASRLTLGTQWEPLSGSATVRIPEPAATLPLLVLAAGIRRRR